MNKPDSNRTEHRPPPPPPPHEWSRPTRPRFDQKAIPNVLRVVIIILTIIGIIFALRTIYKKVTQETSVTSSIDKASQEKEDHNKTSNSVSTADATNSPVDQVSPKSAQTTKEPDSKSTSTESSSDKNDSQGGQDKNSKSKDFGSASASGESDSQKKASPGEMTESGSQGTTSSSKSSGSDSITGSAGRGSQGQDSMKAASKSTESGSTLNSGDQSPRGAEEQGKGTGTAITSENQSSQEKVGKETGSKFSGSTKSKDSGSGGHGSGSDSKPAGFSNIEFRVGELGQELTNIERDNAINKSTIAISGIGIYKMITENLRQSVRVQLAILENAVVTDELSVRRKEIRRKLELVHKFEDTPYYADAISQYSVLLAETSISLLALMTHTSNKDMQAQIASIHNSSIEATCDATFITASAFIAVGKLSGKASLWDDMEHKLKAAQNNDQHILKKTVSAHYTLCNILSQCVQAWDQKNKYADTLVQIKRGQETQIAIATDPFFQFAAYTESEISLIILLTRLIIQ